MLEPTNLLLLACALIYGLMGEPQEAGVLLVFVAGIALLDAQQQHRSRRALAELARLSAPRVRLWRHGQLLELPPEQVQVGDRLRLEEGDRIPADARVLEAVGLWLDTSLLTGESLPVACSEPQTLLQAGSLVASGRAQAEVVAVGAATALGQLGESLRRVEPPPTPLQRRTRQLTGQLTAAALSICVLLAVAQGLLSGLWMQALLAALALALAVLPNEIPVVLALFLALGALRLARIGVLARWPAAVESLGAATVLAVDKTGTLTENRMAVQALLRWPQGDLWRRGEPLAEPWHGLVELAVLASRPDPVDAMEQAIHALTRAETLDAEHVHPEWPLLREYPLQSDLLVFSQLWHDIAGQPHVAAKGAPEAVANLCHLSPTRAEQLMEAAAALAAEGLRVLAVARSLAGAPRHAQRGGGPIPAVPADVHDFLFEPVGLVGLADPLRAEVPAAIARTQQAGVRVVMITGDAPQTARAIADQAGLRPGPVITGAELSAWSPAVLAQRVRQVDVFARVLPEQKLRLVQALQAGGEVVAMTGDGVNDAPALKAADIGVAMGRRGTAVAREAADLVLLNDSFSSLVEALALGRRVDANLQRALGYTLAIHLPIASLTLLPLLLPGTPMLLLPIHIALLHLVIDPACTVVFEGIPAAAAQMHHPPRSPQAPLFGAETWRRSLLQGGLITAAALALALTPAMAAPIQRNLVFSLLLLAGGALVWLTGDARSGTTRWGGAIGVGLWLLVQSSPQILALLELAPLNPPAGQWLVGALVALGAVAGLVHRATGPCRSLPS